jgi:hypothetical protein
MSQIVLTHLTFVGAGRQNATVEFGEGLTVIYGASDTGKSYVVEALDFMLGSQKLRDIPEVDGYSHVLLGLRLVDGSVFTLSRSPKGGRFAVYEEDVRSVPVRPGDLDLAGKHIAKNKENISYFLLSKIGLAGFRVRTNQRNSTREFSIRDVAHVCLVDETRMQAPRSPVLATGQYVSATGEKSAFRIMLTGEDDSALADTSKSTEKKRVSKGKIELLDSVIADLAEQVAQLSDLDELRVRLAKINVAIGEYTAHVGEMRAALDSLVSTRLNLTERQGIVEARMAEINDLIGRFGLLEQQYRSDIARLDMVQEAGTLLGYFDRSICVFCGASPENQNFSEHLDHEATLFSEAISSEKRKTSALLSDLLDTIADMKVQAHGLEQSREDIDDQIRELAEEIYRMDEVMKPVTDAVSGLIDSRSQVERGIGVFDQIAKLEERKARLLGSDEDDDEVAAASLSFGTLREFSDVVKKVLDTWNVPESEHVAFDLKQSDLVVGDQLRSSRGKGMRAILHAAFTVSLAKYCLERELYHPGFVVLDSPVVTYRGPFIDSDFDPTHDEPMSDSVADSLYRQLGAEFGGQAIVVENVTPPAALDESVTEVYFTGSKETGRFGFFPV